VVKTLLLFINSAIKVALKIGLLCTLLISTSVFSLTQVTASIDKNPAMMNESIVLTIIADDDVNQSELDTSALLADFIVGRTSTSSQTSMINFKTTQSTQWRIVLIPRQIGKVTIPALTINNKKTAPISLEVLEKNDTSTTQQDIFITSELSSSEIYVQQLFTLKLKLHFAVELKSGNLSEPLLPNANIEKIGQDQQTSSIINGKRYRVIEQTYAITPQESGKFTLGAPVFSGEILSASRTRSSFLSFAETKPVDVIGEAKIVTVRPIPVSYPQQKPWLPTEILTLHQEWPANDGKFTVGEPITRTITLTAAGLSKAQLPEIIMENTTNLKVYPDQAQLHTNMTKDRLVSQKVQNFAIVPSRQGTFTLPELSITWFNTVTNKVQQATLPSQTITVQPSADFDQKNQANKDTAETGNNSTNNTQSNNQNNTTQPAIVITQNNRLQWLFLALWVLTSLLWFVHIRHLKSKNNSNITKDEFIGEISQGKSEINSYKTLVNACKNNEAHKSLNLILPWTNQLIQQGKFTLAQGQTSITNISQVPQLINDQDFSTALHDLQQHLYGKTSISDSESWQGQVLLNAVTQINKMPVVNKNKQNWTLNP
jgi:hypothetical protein